MYYFLCNVPVSVKSVQISKSGLVEGQLKAVLLYCTINMFRHFSFKKKKKKAKRNTYKYVFSKSDLHINRKFRICRSTFYLPYLNM